jgi:excisionase family DNA binding protein
MVVKEGEAARRIGVAVGTLRAWRSSGRVKLTFLKIGGSIRYRVADLDAFLEGCVQVAGTK